MKTTTNMVIRTMMNVQEPATMYVHFKTDLLAPPLTPFQYSWFHIIFVLGAMYVAMLLTDWYEFIPFLRVGVANAALTQECHPCESVIAFD